jgi:hypothetical protein
MGSINQPQPSLSKKVTSQALILTVKLRKLALFAKVQLKKPPL